MSLSLPFMSFENALKREYGVSVAQKHGERGSQCRVFGRNGSSTPWMSDDVLSTVAGDLLQQAKRLFPDLALLQHCPVVSVGARDNVFGFLDEFDLAQFDVRVIGPLRERDQYDDLIAAYDHAIGLADSNKRKCLLIDAIFRVFLCMRGELPDLGDGQEMPSCDKTEWWSVFKEGLRKSVKLPLTASELAELQKVHPDGKVVNGHFILYQRYDPFILIRSEAGAKQDLADIVRVLSEDCSNPLAIEQHAASEIEQPVAGVNEEQLGVDFVMAKVGAGTRLAAMTPEEKDEFLYGSAVGKIIFERGISANWRGKMWQKLCDVGYSGTPLATIRLIATALLKKSSVVTVPQGLLTGYGEGVGDSTVTVKPDYRFYCLLAGGRVLSMSHGWELEPGLWTRKQ